MFPERVLLETPEPFLRWASAESRSAVSLDEITSLEVWGLAGLAALARSGQEVSSAVSSKGSGRVSLFAKSLGFEAVTRGRDPISKGEIGRTVKLTRLVRFEELEPAAAQITRLLIPETEIEEEESRKAIYYVLVELLRNVVQHSMDPQGGIVGAQLMYESDPNRPTMIQVAVADAGIGIERSLRGLHRDIIDPRQALERSLWPHISGTFEKGLSGTSQNAGLGLFFIAEMAKLLAGRLMIASRGAALLLKGDPEGEGHHSETFIGSEGTGFPGTLVAFELPAREVKDYDALIATITALAKTRSPRREIHHWLRFELPPQDAQTFIVPIAAEDTSKAQIFARESLEPRIIERKDIVLDFRGMRICTQSYLHALLHDALRLAWARRTGIYIVNAAPAVRSGLDLLESYSLGG